MLVRGQGHDAKRLAFCAEHFSGMAFPPGRRDVMLHEPNPVAFSQALRRQADRNGDIGVQRKSHGFRLESGW